MDNNNDNGCANKVNKIDKENKVMISTKVVVRMLLKI